MLRLKSKEDIGRHAEDILRKTKTANEKKARCLYIAQLYFDVGEYEQVISYVKEYLSLKNSSVAFKLLGQAYEALNLKDNALSAYEKCFKFDDTQHELLLKICELYCEPDLILDRTKAKSILERTQKYFPYHSTVYRLRERIVDDSASLDKDEYEKLLACEIKKNPEECKYRIKLMKLYLSSDRTELAYRSCVGIENNKMFTRKIEWYDCLDKVYQAYSDSCPTQCDYNFFINRLHCLDSLCALSYSHETGLHTDDCCDPIVRMDKLLFQIGDKFTSEEYRSAVDHYSAQLSFHIAMVIALKTKEKADYVSDVQNEQIWFENKIKIGALLLFSVKDGLPKPSLLDKYRDKTSGQDLRFVESKARYVQVYYTIRSLSKNNNQGSKQFFDSTNYFTAGRWREEVFKMLDAKSTVDPGKSYFVNSDYYKGSPPRLPENLEMWDLMDSFESIYGSSLHDMIWIGLQTLNNPNDPSAMSIHPNFHSTAFSSLNLTSANLVNSNPESINQLDMDSFLYLTVFCKALQSKLNGSNRQVVLPSCITSKLSTPKENTFWTNALALARDLAKEKDSKWLQPMKAAEVSESGRFDIRLVLEQVRGHRLQLPLVVLLARAFSLRTNNESPVVRNACEKRAYHLWDSVLLKIKLYSRNVSVDQIKSPFFEFNGSSFSNSEVKAVRDEARMNIGSYYFKNGVYDLALEFYKQVQSGQSLYKQALVYEALALKEADPHDGRNPETKSRQTLNSDKCHDCLIRCLGLLESAGEQNTPLAKEVREKLHVWNKDSGDNYSPQPWKNGSDVDDTYASTQYMELTGVNERTMFISSTPRRNRESLPQTQEVPMPGGKISMGYQELGEILSSYKNQLKLQSLEDSFKLLSERFDNFQITFGNRMDKLESNLKSYFNDLKKEIKQKPDLYNMLEEDDYSPDPEVVNYPNYYQNAVQRSSAGGLIPGAGAYGGAAAPSAALTTAAPAYFAPNQIYQGGVPFYGQTLPFPADPQMADYLRTLASQRGNALGALPTVAGIHQPALVPPALAQVGVSSPCSALAQVGVSSPSSNKPVVQPQQAPNNVVITTSDSLPTSVPTTAPTLFVNIPPEHRLGSAPTMTTTVQTSVVPTVTTPVVSAPHKFQIPMPSNFKLVEKAPVDDPADDKELEVTLEVSKDSDGGTHLEYDPLPNFKAVIPLPDEVEVKTGEENETVIFDNRAKLFRKVDNEWKERGIGQMKILKSLDEPPRYRIIMRREQVHKICANHFITADMKLVKASGNDKSYIWIAHDFADEKVQVETLLVRFKTVPEGELFKDKFEEARRKVVESSPIVSQNKTEVRPLKGIDLSQPPKSTVATDQKDKITMGGFTFTSQPKIVENEPQVVRVEEKKQSPFASFNFGSTKSQTSSFGFSSNKTGGNDGNKSEGGSKLFELLKQQADGWECSGCYSRNSAASKECVACKAPAPDTGDKGVKTPSSEVGKKETSQPSLSSLFKVPQGSWNCDVCLVQNKPEVSACVACGTVKPGCKPEQKVVEAPTYTFGIPQATPPVTPSKPIQSVFGQTPADSSTKTTPPPSGPGIFTFGVPAPLKTSSENFTFGSSKFNFSMAMPPHKDDEYKGAVSPLSTPKKSDADDTDNEQNDEDHDHDHTEGIYFQPVVEMPDKIDVTTGEEDETVVYSQRSKLFRFDPEVKEWKEKGVGDVKILKHKITQRIRILMRREPVMKLCLNHNLTPDLELKPKDPKSWMWCAPDYSEGTQISENFCIRFKTPDIAMEFKENFDSAKIGEVPDDSNSDDVVFVSESKIVSDELRNKAVALKLPENFYKYLDMPGCCGCRGCEGDSDGEVVKIKAPSDAKQQTTSLFGSNVSNSQPVFFGSKSPSSVSAKSQASNATPPPTSSNVGLIKPSILTSKGDTDKVNAFSFSTPTNKVATTASQEPVKSQISTFSFAVTQQSGVTSTPTAPVFSFSSQNSIFAGIPSIPNQNILGGGSTTVQPSSTAVSNSSYFLGSNNSPLFGSSPSFATSEISANPVFGSKTKTQSDTPIFTNKETTSVFGASKDVPKTEESAVNKSFFGTVSWPGTATQDATKEETKGDGFLFSALAGAAVNNSFAGDNTNFKWEGVGTKLFGSQAKSPPVDHSKKEEEDEDEDKNNGQESEDHDPYFEPVVPLPDKIELKTGEEDEDLLFSERAKLFRRDPATKEWKERGVGNMKVLKHRVRGTCRLLMRRDQVHKIVCNHLITPDIKLNQHTSSDAIYCWGAMNMSQDDTEPSMELLCVKFKNSDIALQFKDAFEAAKQQSTTD